MSYKVSQTESYYKIEKAIPSITLGLWSLPSKDEWSKIYNEVQQHGLGNFGYNDYWMSSEFNSGSAWYMILSTGTVTFNNKATLFAVRPFRSFTTIAITYDLRDIGPGGGYIFYINGDTYYELYPTDISAGIVWSNISLLIGTTGTAIGTGAQNTLDIIGQAGHTASAAKLCNDLNG